MTQPDTQERKHAGVVVKPCRVCKQPYEPKPHQLRKYDYICHPCSQEYQRNYRDMRVKAGNPMIPGKASPEYIREYEKRRKNDPRRKRNVAERMQKYYRDPRLKHKYKARRLTRTAIESGKLVRQPCEICGAKENIDAHHDDYAKPLDVRWLCKKHHQEHHSKLRAALAEGKEGGAGD